MVAHSKNNNSVQLRRYYNYEAYIPYHLVDLLQNLPQKTQFPPLPITLSATLFALAICLFTPLMIES